MYQIQQIQLLLFDTTSGLSYTHILRKIITLHKQMHLHVNQTFLGRPECDAAEISRQFPCLGMTPLG